MQHTMMLPTEEAHATENPITFPLLVPSGQPSATVVCLPSRLLTLTGPDKWGDYKDLVDICTLLSVFPNVFFFLFLLWFFMHVKVFWIKTCNPTNMFLSISPKLFGCHSEHSQNLFSHRVDPIFTICEEKYLLDAFIMACEQNVGAPHCLAGTCKWIFNEDAG